MKGQSAIEYLMTYGWMLLVVAIVGGAIITTVQNDQAPTQELNTTQVENFLEERTQRDCEVEEGYSEDEAEAVCYRDDGIYENTSYKFANNYEIEKKNGSVVIERDFN